MSMDVARRKDADPSAECFMEEVVPILKKQLGFDGWKFLSLESLFNDNLLVEFFDNTVGIDALAISPRKITYGIAQRCTFMADSNGEPYRNFTIRYSRSSGKRTQYAKEMARLFSDGSLGSYWTIQADAGSRKYPEVTGLAVVETKVLYGYLMWRMAGNGMHGKLQPMQVSDGNTFLSVGWEEMLADGFPLYKCWFKEKGVVVR